MLGANLVFYASRRYRVFGLSRSVPVRSASLQWVQRDLSDKASIHNCLNRIAPDIVVHAAAMTNVDACENDPNSAEEQNVFVSSEIAEWARAHQSFFVFISTDSVFDGLEGRYSENARPNPLNVYARTKLAGEEMARSICPASLILRTNFYGWNYQAKLSLGEWVLRGLLQKERRTMFADVFFSPLYAGDLARVILDLVKARAEGVYHAGASDGCSKYAFSLLMAEIFGLDAGSIAPVSVESFPFDAKRPKDTTLRVEKLSNLLGRAMPTIEEGMRKFHNSLQSGFVKSLKGELPNWLAAYCNE